MFQVGLTGGIACGKSHTLRELRKLGAYTIDADQIAHDVIQRGQPAYEAVVNHFGREILDAQGSIDRGKLGKIVFSDASARQRLNELVHPHVLAQEEHLKQEILDNATRLRSPILVVDAALMVEVGSYRRYEVLIVVYCHPAIQLKRLMSRDGLSEEDALRRIQSQMPLLEKIKYADYIIENSRKLSDTNHQIKQTFAELVNRYEETSV
ncbi:MAG: dephospho-CoA kinase [Acidobacteria bacterium]|nr:dephospho-CoA kinase [Acidobacteriota bacterium]